MYLFDTDGILQLHATDNGDKLEYSYLQNGQIQTVSKPNPWGKLSDEYVMNLDKVPPGKYRIISWADNGQKDNTTYLHGEMKNPASHNLRKDVTLGATMADDLYMFLKCRTASGLPEELVPEAEEINDLWYGAAGSRHPQSDIYTYETVEVKNSVVTTRRIELIRNTNLLKITLSGTEHLTPEVRDTPAANRDTDFKLWAVATDERYKSDNTFDGYTRSVRYSPFKTSMDVNTLSADIKVLRLTMDRPVLLYIETPGGRRIPEQPIDIVSMLFKARNPDTGAYIYQSQSDFDRI